MHIHVYIHKQLCTYIHVNTVHTFQFTLYNVQCTYFNIYCTMYTWYTLFNKRNNKRINKHNIYICIPLHTQYTSGNHTRTYTYTYV